ncbi:hypothetical protein ACFFIZ_11960 [Paracoccus rhizosphaerae]|uniref:Lipopolysaccharide assembly protein A domain-containing protein n=2 Tax=Paracoccus rhizosphaerae TaxID=1133347 RepID=A0ABV6CPS0_9RHOB
MRGDAMRWIGWLVALVFLGGVLALVSLVVSLVTRAEGVPPMPIYMGILGFVALIMLSGACLALISIAVSARRAVELMQRGARPLAEAADKPQGPLRPTPLAEVPAAPRAGKVLVAER